MKIEKEWVESFAHFSAKGEALSMIHCANARLVRFAVRCQYFC